VSLLSVQEGGPLTTIQDAGRFGHLRVGMEDNIYIERGKLTPIASLELDEHATVLADVSKVTRKPMRARRGTMTEVVVTDGTRPLSLVFFTQKIPNLNKLVPGKRIGFDVVVVDLDSAGGKPAWICWGPMGALKFFDSSLLGDLILGRDP